MEAGAGDPVSLLLPARTSDRQTPVEDVAVLGSSLYVREYDFATDHQYQRHITLGTSAADNVTGSAGLDNIRVCTRQEQLGDEGCTPGYWKNHPASWTATGYTRTQTLESVFLHHAVAALLNASHPGVDYPRTAASIISPMPTPHSRLVLERRCSR